MSVTGVKCVQCSFSLMSKELPCSIQERTSCLLNKMKTTHPVLILFKPHGRLFPSLLNFAQKQAFLCTKGNIFIKHCVNNARNLSRVPGNFLPSLLTRRRGLQFIFLECQDKTRKGLNSYGNHRNLCRRRNEMEYLGGGPS